VPPERGGYAIHVGPQGRVVIPAAVREALAIGPGDTLVGRIEDGQLVLEKREHILAKWKAEFAKIPRDVSLVDELIAERRAEARKEAEEP